MPSYATSTHHEPESYRYDDYYHQNEDAYYSTMNDSRDYHHYPKHVRNNQPAYSRSTAPPPRPPKVRWPPSPSVEDEVTSLSREHSPSLPELESSEVKMRGSIDQQPIILEVGKENEAKAEKSKTTAPRKKKGVRFEPESSDESSGPPTPIDASPIQESRFEQRSRPQSKRDSRESLSDRRPNAPLASPSIQDVISKSVRPRRAASQLDRVKEQEAKSHTDRQKSSRDRTPYAQSSDSSRHNYPQNYFESQPHEPQYPGTLEELKSSGRRGDSKGHPQHLPFAERHRTMSGSSDAADHRPLNMRHMSAMGYYGESKTPSFGRDHPAHLHSPEPPDPRIVPAFRTPRPSKGHRTDAVDSDSDSDISPDESPRKEKTSSRYPVKTEGVGSFSQSTQHDYPVRPQQDHPTQYQRTATPVGQSRDLPARPLPNRLKTQGLQDPSSSRPARSPRPTPHASPSGSPRNSIHGTPPASPRPDSRDGSSKEDSPIFMKSQQQLPRTSPATTTTIPSYPAVPHLKCATDQHHHPNLRYPSRPSSPALHPGDVPVERQSREASIQSNASRSRQSSSPLPAPTPSRTLKPDLRIDVQGPTPEPPIRTGNSPRPNLLNRLVSGDLSTQFYTHSPQAPTSAPFWAAEHERSQRHEGPFGSPLPAQPPPPQPRPPARAPPTALPSCPRPGFVTGYNDWWTLRNAPDLDICPNCKENLEAAGSSASFVRSPPRSTSHQTRCDLSIPWVRMAWLLALQGKASRSLIHDVIVGIAHEPPCPGRLPANRPWRRLYDAEHGKFIPNFDVCPSCVRSVETLFPNLRGQFEAVPHSDPNKKRTCSLSYESPRFARYVDLLEEVSNQAHIYRREPNMLRFVGLARTFADVRPCRRDDQFRGEAWHFMPHLPDFTVCEECYLDIVWPAVTRGSEVAKSFNGSLHYPPHAANMKMSCQLYSVRMRVVFERACQAGDFEGLRREALARVGKERELQGRAEKTKGLPPELIEGEMGALIAEWRRWE